MSGLLPVAVYGLEVPSGDVITPAVPDFPATAFRITMAAIDPSASPDSNGSTNGDTPARATLKIIRQPPGMEESDDESDDEPDTAEYLEQLLNGEGSDEEDSEESSDEEEEEEANGGPSDPSKSKKARREQALQNAFKELQKGGADSDSDEEMDTPNGVNGAISKAKGKAKATGIEDSDEDDDDEEGLEMEEFVLCTLDPTKMYQQPLDITVGEDDRVFFKVTGTHTVYLTGNYVVPTDDDQRDQDMYDSDEEDYDLSPDEDELDDEAESDELDDMEDPRIKELPSSDEEAEAPPLVKAAGAKKGKNKRPAEASDEEPTNLDDIMTKSLKPAQATENGEKKLSKKQLKKMKNNAGEAVDATTASKTAKPDEKSATKGDRKVQFAKNLEQGPAKPSESKSPPGKRVVQGVTIEDKKAGKGPAAKKGDRVGMRYIGKLQSNNFQFDANKGGAPFTFKLGAGEVIKGWEAGVTGMTAGSERRIIVPPSMGYGSRALPGIPANSTLVFEIRLLHIK
ncbi:MAG: hypothetical protein M4579_003876 [Chaenotheca gracillima]|nr:MAG: hypothetical protein M4579_003876 [Chaenotheca gracillima]